MGLRDTFHIFAKMPIFGFLIGLPVWVGNANKEDLILGKTREYSKRRSGGVRQRFVFSVL
jgi:hypothetical protein